MFFIVTLEERIQGYMDQMLVPVSLVCLALSCPILLLCGDFFFIVATFFCHLEVVPFVPT